MQDVILAVIFIVVPVVAVLISFILGFKRNIYQSASKLVMTILSIIVCAIVVKSITPFAISSIIDAVGLADEEIISYFLTSSISYDNLKLASSIFMPLVFFVAYLVFAFVFSLLYLIPGRLLSDKAFARRAATRAVRKSEAEVIKDDVDESRHSEMLVGKKSFNWKRIGCRTGAFVCSILSAILVLSAFALPIHSCSRLMSIVTDDLGEVIELDPDTTDIFNIIEDVNSHPTNQCYNALNGVLADYFDRFTANDGTRVVVSESISSMISVVQTIAELDTSAINPESFYNLAERIGENSYVCNTVTQLARDLCNAWLKGESFLGVPAPDLDGQIMNILLTKLSDCEDITIVLRAVGDALKLQQAMVNNSGTGETVDTATIIGQLFGRIDSGSADMIKTFVSEEMLADIVAMPPAMAQSVSGFVGNVVDGIVVIKNDPSLSNEEKVTILNQEASAMAVIVDMTKDPENINPIDLVGAVANSSVISGTIQKITDNGAVRDPYEIADTLEPEFTESVENEMKNQGIEEDSELFDSIMALISK